MGLLYLTQSGSQDLDLSSDGFTDTLDMVSLNQSVKDLQIVRTVGTGQPLITFQISNDGINWANWEVEGFIFKDLNSMFIFGQLKKTFFRINWLSNTSTGTFKANFNTL
jgi:hypothetical protein